MYGLFYLEPSMTMRKITLFVCLIFCIAAPLSAQTQTKWTEEFLMRFNPAEHRSTDAAAPPPPSQVVAQVFQTGTVPIGMQEVITMMLDHNLDIRSNRFTPRSTALQTLVFYRTFQPSIRFSSTISRDTSASTSQLNGAGTLSNLRHQFALNFTQPLKWGTTVAVDATMNRQSNNSIVNTFNPSYTSLVRYSVTQHLLRDRCFTLRSSPANTRSQ